jgi:hypothetical protein
MMAGDASALTCELTLAMGPNGAVKARKTFQNDRNSQFGRSAVLMASLPPALNVFVIARLNKAWVEQASVPC